MQRIFFIFGCIASFENTVQATIKSDRGNLVRTNDKDRVLNLIQEFAETNDLSYDSTESIPGEKIGYFGSPYHYYTIEVSDSLNGTFINISFTHFGMMSSPKYRHDETEKAFVDSLNKIFNSRITRLDYQISN